MYSEDSIRIELADGVNVTAKSVQTRTSFQTSRNT